jgi:hypothetical protein
MGAKTLALLRKLDAACTARRSWVLAEIGDDRSRFADARALKSRAGTAPITRACGKKTSVWVAPGQERPPGHRGLPLSLLRPAALEPGPTTTDAEPQETGALPPRASSPAAARLPVRLQTRTLYETTAFPTPDDTELELAA